MKAMSGLFTCCVLIPAVYAGLVYWYVVPYGAVPLKDDALVLAVLIALPLVVGGFPKWWDVWILAPPKIGSPWTAPSPTEFVARAVTWHTIAISLSVAVNLVSSQALAEMLTHPKLTLNVPEAQAQLKNIDVELARIRNWIVTDEDRLAVNRLEDKRWWITRQLEEHEETIRLLEARGEISGHHFIPYAFGILVFSAITYSLHAPVKKRLHSGEPIGRR